MTTNDPAIAAATEISDTLVALMERLGFRAVTAAHQGKSLDTVDISDLTEGPKMTAIIRRHYAPLQQQLVGANVELAELRRANEVRTKSQQQLMAEIATNTETILHLQAELFKSRGECERLRKALESITRVDCDCDDPYCPFCIARAALKAITGEKGARDEWA